MSRHPHGTPARYRGNANTPGCRCRPCTSAAVREDSKRQLDRLAGRPRLVPINTITGHIAALRARDICDKDITRAAGLDGHHLNSMLKQKRVNHRTAEKILSVPLDYEPVPQYLPSIGATRRLQALYVMYHSGGEIAAESDLTNAGIWRLIHGQCSEVKASTHESVRVLYTRWRGVLGKSLKAHNLAVRNGWHGPLAWDDIDNPDEQPESGDPAPPPELGKRDLVHQLAEERVADIVLLASAGNQLDQIATRTGLTKDYVRKRLQAARPTTLLELTA